MQKSLKLILGLVFIVVLIAALTACSGESQPDLKLEAISSNVSYVQGSGDLSDVSFKLVDKNGKTVDIIAADTSMLSTEDLEVLQKETGIHSFTFNYKGYEVTVSINISRPAQINNYSVTFHAGEGLFPAEVSGAQQSNIKTISLDSLGEGKNAITRLPSPTLENHKFEGWYKSDKFEGNRVGVPYVVTYTHTLYAKWTSSEKINVTFYNEFDTPLHQTKQVDKGGDLMPPIAPTKDGYRFIGWEYGGKIYTTNEAIKNVTSDITVIAKYEKIQYTITFQSEEWDNDVIISVDMGGSFVLEPLPEKIGHNGVWLDRNTDNAPRLNNVLSDMIIYAKYERKDVTVRFIYGESTVVRNLKYGDRLDSIPNAALTGYTYVWQYERSGRWEDAEVIFSQGITRDYEIRASYTIKRYNLTYHYGGNTTVVTYNHGTNIEVKDLPSIISNSYPAKYYTVTWHRGSTSGSPLVEFPISMVNGNVNIYAQIKENPFKVDFYLPKKDNEGNPLSVTNFHLATRTVVKGGSVTPPQYNNDKYEVRGWVNRSGEPITNFNNIQDFYEYNIDPSLDRAIYAVVGIRSYNVTFNNVRIEETSEGQKYLNYEVDKNSRKYGTKLTYHPVEALDILPFDYLELTPPIYPGETESTFVFDGWYTDAEFKTARVDFTKGYEIKKATMFYAKWLDAEKGTEGLQFTPVYDDGGSVLSYALSGFDAKEERYARVLIPHTYEGLPVTHIYKTAFENIYVTIESIEFGANILCIEEASFMFLRELQSIAFIDEIQPETVTIDEWGVLYSKGGVLLAFPATLDLSSYQVPYEVEGVEITKIGEGAFALAKNLNEVTFASNSKVTTIGKYAFYANNSLEKIVLPESLQAIMERAFCDSKMLKTISFTENNSIEFVGFEAFEGTYWYLQSSDDLLMVGNVLVMYRGKDTTLEINDSVTAIADNAFGREVSTLPLTTIKIGENSNLRVIGKNAFDGCFNLENIYIASLEELEIDTTAFSGISKNAVLYVNAEMLDYYKSLDFLINIFGETGIRAIS